MTNCNYSEHTKIQRKEIQKQIEELQAKLEELEKQEPDMMLLRQGKVDFVDYNGKGGNKYIRIEYTDSFADDYIWYVRRVGEDAIRPVRDVNVYTPLEELYQKEVVKQKDDYTYKKYTPEETEQSLKKAFREAVKQGVVSSNTKPQTLYDVIADWWDEIFTNGNPSGQNIESLVEQIVKLLPDEVNDPSACDGWDIAWNGGYNAYRHILIKKFNGK